MRYHLKSYNVVVPALTTVNFPFGAESFDNVCENIALWIEGSGCTWTVKYNGVTSASTGAYIAGVAKKVFTEAGPLATMITYPSVDILAGATDARIVLTWVSLIRQVNG